MKAISTFLILSLFIFLPFLTFCTKSSSTSVPNNDDTQYNLGQLINDPVYLPIGGEISIDGRIDETAWQTALSFVLAENENVLLTYFNGYLYIGIKTKPTPVSNVFLYRENKIYLLHSSAAVGSAVYEYNGSTWTKIKDFTWHCRDWSSSESAENARQQFLADEGWIASIGYAGAPTETEFKIAMNEESLLISVATVGEPNYNVLSLWPDNLTDACINPLMVQGSIPDTAVFVPEQWIQLIKPN